MEPNEQLTATVRAALTAAYIEYATNASNQTLDPLVHVDLVNALTKSVVNALAGSAATLEEDPS